MDIPWQLRPPQVHSNAAVRPIRRRLGQQWLVLLQVTELGQPVLPVVAAEVQPKADKIGLASNIYGDRADWDFPKYAKVALRIHWLWCRE
jgi:hypothetical protein